MIRRHMRTFIEINAPYASIYPNSIHFLVLYRLSET